MPAQPIVPLPVSHWRFSTLALAMAALTLYLGYFADRNHFPAFISGYGCLFALYVWACFFQKSIPARHLVALGIALRVLLLFSLPNLSDDYCRFLWDGRLSIAGYHPFLHPPSYFIENQILPPGISPALFGQLNSPHYFTVYPPVCQAVFAGAVWVAPESDRIGVLLMKLFLLACEIGTIGLLAGRGWPLAKKETEVPAPPPSTPNPNPKPETRQRLTANRQLLYALNPLLILEIVGNCHFEGAMIFFLAAGMVAFREGKVAGSAVYWALATASKMLPLLFLPIVWRWLGWRKGFVFHAVFTLAMLILFAPLLGVLPNIAQSLGLYFQKFQFNASLYYLVREIGYSKIGWDIGEVSGPWMGAATVLGVLIVALLSRGKTGASEERLAGAMLFALLLYLSFSAVVQPWYVCVPLAVSLFTRWRFAVLWSGLVALSYSHYDNGLREEHFGLIALEYVVVWGFLGWEVWRYWRGKPLSKSST